MPFDHLQSSIYFSAFLLCALFASVLFQQNRYAHRFLIVFLCADALGFLFEWFMFKSQQPITWAWMALFMAVSFISAPSLWLFARSVTGREVALKALSTWHWAVVVLGMVLTLPLFSASYLFFPEAFSKFLGSSIHTTMVLCILLFFIQVPFYLSQCVRLFIDQVGHVKSFSASLRHSSLRILLTLIVLVIVNWLANMTRAMNEWFFGHDPTMNGIAIIADAMVTVVGLSVLFHQLLASNAQEAQSIVALPSKKTADNKYAKAQLDEATRQRILQKLSDTHQLASCLLANNISLTSLATELGEKPQYLTQVLSTELNTNFYDFVTRFRIDEVKARLLDSPEANILDIAYAAGFNSKSTFNTAFKKQTGLTPSAFRLKKRSNHVV